MEKKKRNENKHATAESVATDINTAAPRPYVSYRVVRHNVVSVERFRRRRRRRRLNGVFVRVFRGAGRRGRRAAGRRKGRVPVLVRAGRRRLSDARRRRRCGRAHPVCRARRPGAGLRDARQERGRGRFRRRYRRPQRPCHSDQLDGHSLRRTRRRWR